MCHTSHVDEEMKIHYEFYFTFRVGKNEVNDGHLAGS